MSQPEPVPAPALPGAQYLAEIREQPAALRRLLEHRAEFARVAEAATKHGTGIIRMVGHGSSDNAASFGVYAFGLLPGLTAARDSISLLVYYGAKVDLRGSVVVALSQSGQTPDVLEYVERARQGGAFTIAVTNESESELARAAEAVLPLSAGAELAVAATKTYSNQLAALALLAGCLAGRCDELAGLLGEVADQIEEQIPEFERLARSFSIPFTAVARMFVIGRGPEFATAREIALKLLETCQIAAEPLTATDLAHGPVAALDPAVSGLGDRRARTRPSAWSSTRPSGHDRPVRPWSRAAPPRRRSQTPSTWCPCRSRGCRSSLRSSPSCPASCSPAPSRARRASTPTNRGDCRRSRSRGSPAVIPAESPKDLRRLFSGLRRPSRRGESPAACGVRRARRRAPGSPAARS